MIEPAGPDPLPAVPEDDGRRATGDRPRVLLVAALVFLVPVTIVFLATEGIDRADRYASVFGLFAGISSVLLGLVSLFPRRRDRQAGPGDGAGPGSNAPGGRGTGTGGGPRSRQRSRTFGFTAGVVGTTILSCTVATTTQSSLNAPPPVDEPPPLAVVAAVDWAGATARCSPRRRPPGSRPRRGGTRPGTGPTGSPGSAAPGPAPPG
ncbi:hypothetical protein ACQP0I_15410 [Micromonospora carbonacea]|uniref:hypothetical protein n=1 Tax=Micromonospora carbonacea TaxID=47853 RepID=UPI003D97B375